MSQAAGWGEEVWGAPLPEHRMTTALPSSSAGSSHLVVGPAGLPDAQGLGLRKLPFEAEQEPAMAEQHLQAVLAQRDQVLVEALVCQPQQLPQVQLVMAGGGGCYPDPGKTCPPGPERPYSGHLQAQKHTQEESLSVCQTHQPATLSDYHWSPPTSSPSLSPPSLSRVCNKCVCV